ncbi:helix-hairpin-helix domain-containing protein [bacterium]|nr:helix-hairpin-helix domain-containing protein [candidate division CSSED10-310 bacterium]
MTVFSKNQTLLIAFMVILISVFHGIRSRGRIELDPGIESEPITHAVATLPDPVRPPDPDEQHPRLLFEEPLPGGTARIVQYIPFPDRIDINTATPELLAVLPGIGPSLSETIVLDRECRGRFRDPADLIRVPGVRRELIRSLEGLITAGADFRSK